MDIPVDETTKESKVVPGPALVDPVPENDIVSWDVDPNCKMVDVSLTTEGDQIGIIVDFWYYVSGDQWRKINLTQNGNLHTGQLDLTSLWPPDGVMDLTWFFMSTYNGDVDATPQEDFEWCGEWCVPILPEEYIWAYWNGSHTTLTITWFVHYGFNAKSIVRWGYSPTALNNVVEGEITNGYNQWGEVEINVLPWQGCVYYEITSDPFCDDHAATTSLQTATSAVCWSDCLNDVNALFSSALCKFVVTWPTDVMSTSTVYYGTNPDNLTQTATTPGDTYNHRVEIDAGPFAGGTQLYYAIESVSPCGNTLWYQPCGPSGCDYMTKGTCGGGGKPKPRIEP